LLVNDVLETYCKKQGGIPWTVILDAQAKALANADGPKGDIGFPYEPEEIERFVGMVKQTSRKLNATQIEQVAEALRKSRAEIEQQRGKQQWGLDQGPKAAVNQTGFEAAFFRLTNDKKPKKRRKPPQSCTLSADDFTPPLVRELSGHVDACLLLTDSSCRHP
jgi:hypothetical protein